MIATKIHTKYTLNYEILEEFCTSGKWEEHQPSPSCSTLYIEVLASTEDRKIKHSTGRLATSTPLGLFSRAGQILREGPSKQLPGRTKMDGGPSTQCEWPSIFFPLLSRTFKFASLLVSRSPLHRNNQLQLGQGKAVDQVLLKLLSPSSTWWFSLLTSSRGSWHSWVPYFLRFCSINCGASDSPTTAVD